jgi:hypothetical protein
MTMGVTNITMMMDDVGTILGWLQGRRCVPDHPTHCAMLDETHEGGCWTSIKGRGLGGVYPFLSFIPSRGS